MNLEGRRQQLLSTLPLLPPNPTQAGHVFIFCWLIFKCSCNSNFLENDKLKMANSDKETKDTEKGYFSKLNNDATLTGVVKSTFSNARRGIEMVSTGTDELVRSSKKMITDSRVETFDKAMQRMSVDPSDLPLIHNQIVSQSYISFFAGLIAFAMSAFYWMAGNLIGSALLCTVVGVTSLFYFFQSSAQALQIRRKKLGLLTTLLLSPSEWFASRMLNLRAMTDTDPLRLASVVEPMAKKSQFRYGFALLFFIAGVFFKVTDLEAHYGPWGILFLAIACVFTLIATTASFEVFRRREGLHCDVALWFFSPLSWVPGATDSRDLKSKFKHLIDRVQSD